MPGDGVLPYVTFAYNTAVQETTQITPFNLVYRRNSTTTLDALLQHVTHEENLDVAAYLQRAEEGRQLAHLRIKNQQRGPTAGSTIFDDATWNTSPATVFTSGFRYADED